MKGSLRAQSQHFKLNHIIVFDDWYYYFADEGTLS